MTIIIYVIPYQFHYYNCGLMITISKHHAIMVIKLCNTIWIIVMEDVSNNWCSIFKIWNTHLEYIYIVTTCRFMQKFNFYYPLMSCHVATCSPKKLLTTYGLPSDNLKLKLLFLTQSCDATWQPRPRILAHAT